MNNQLTQLQSQILESIRDDIKQKRDMNIKECAKRNYVSTAFLVKLAKKLGYQGYKELVLKIDASEMITPSENDDGYSRYIYNYSENMRTHFNELLTADHRKFLYLCGVGYSALVCEYIGKKAVKNGYYAVFTEKFIEMDFQDVILICVSESGESDGVVADSQIAHTNGVPVISFTRNPSSRLSRSSDLTVLVSKTAMEDETGINSFSGNAIVAFELLSASIMRKQ